MGMMAQIEVGNDLKEAICRHRVIVCSCAITAYFRHKNVNSNVVKLLGNLGLGETMEKYNSLGLAWGGILLRQKVVMLKWLNCVLFENAL